MTKGTGVGIRLVAYWRGIHSAVVRIEKSQELASQIGLGRFDVVVHGRVGSTINQNGAVLQKDIVDEACRFHRDGAKASNGIAV